MSSKIKTCTKSLWKQLFHTMATEYDLILSDSCTCTSDETGKDECWQDWNGHEFRNELVKHGFQGTFWPLWGKGLQEMCDAIQWFKDEGDAIILLGQALNSDDPLMGLGGSALLQVEHGRKEGTPPPCDLAKEKTLHDALLGLIETDVVKSAHDCAEGGLAVAAAECAISELTARQTPRLTGAEIDLSDVKSERVDALLYGEAHGRVIITTSEAEAGAAIERPPLADKTMKREEHSLTDAVVILAGVLVAVGNAVALWRRR